MGYDGYAWFSGDGVGGRGGFLGEGVGQMLMVLCCAVLCCVGRDSRGVGRGT